MVHNLNIPKHTTSPMASVNRWEITFLKCHLRYTFKLRTSILMCSRVVKKRSAYVRDLLEAESDRARERVMTCVLSVWQYESATISASKAELLAGPAAFDLICVYWFSYRIRNKPPPGTRCVVIVGRTVKQDMPRPPEKKSSSITVEVGAWKEEMQKVCSG